MRKIAIGLIPVVLVTSVWFFQSRYRIQIIPRPRPPRKVQAAYERGEYVEAIRLALIVLNQDSDHPGALLSVARASAQLGRWEKAEGYFAQVLLTDPPDFHLRASGLEQRKLWADAARVWQECLRSFPGDAQSLQHLSIIRIRENNVDEASVYAARLTGLPGHRLTGLVISGMLNYHKSEFAAAADFFLEAVALDADLKGVPSEPALVYQWLADSLRRIGKTAEAEEYALRSRDQSKSAECAWMLGRIRRDMGDLDGAKSFWEESNALNPNDIRPMNDLGSYYLQTGDPENSLSWYQQVLKMNPFDEDAQVGLKAAQRQIVAKKKRMNANSEKEQL